MRVYDQRFTVAYDYPVYFGWDMFRPENPALVESVARREPSRRHRVAFVVERRVAQVWPRLLGDIERYVVSHRERFGLVAPPLVVPGGEGCKNDRTAADRMCAAFDAWRLDRQSAVVIVGGGALQDMAGYAAAITHRGLRVVRVPTTVLSQNDSGVGVKNGINLFDKKNFLGTFAPPFAVIDDFRFLETLDPRDKAAGMAEAIKVALIKDGEFFAWLEGRVADLRAFEPAAVAEMIERCARLHLEHIAISGDPFELGSSRPLDFGHWAAHKLETLTSYDLRHGEAVAIGLALDTRYSCAAGLLSEDDAERVVELIEALGLPIYDEALARRDACGRLVVLDGIAEFREHLGGELTLMMLAGIGRGHEVTEIDEGRVEDCITWLADRARAHDSPEAGHSADVLAGWGPK